MVRPRLPRLAMGVMCVVAAGWFLSGRGVVGREGAVEAAARAVQALGFVPVGGAEVVGEADQTLAWALERSRPGRAGRQLPFGEGGAVRYRVRWQGGGEAAVTADGLAWLVRRPVPTDPGPDLTPTAARDVAAAVVAALAPAAEEFCVVRAQSFREEERLWHRLRWLGPAGPLPAGWEREIEVEVAGATVVSFLRRVKPLGTDLGVVAARALELQTLRGAAVVALGLVVLGVLLAGAEGVAFHERLAVFRGLVLGGLVVGLELVGGGEGRVAVLLGVVTGTAWAVMPVWTALAPSRASHGIPFGVVAAGVASVVPALVVGGGGFMPATPELSVAGEPWRLAAQAWGVALTEEALLRGALVGLAAPVTGFWGAALLSIFVGSLLHPLPAVPLVASVVGAGVVQLGMALAARHAGVGAAVVGRGIAEGLLRRGAFPAGLPWSLLALLPVVVGAIALSARRREG